MGRGRVFLFAVLLLFLTGCAARQARQLEVGAEPECTEFLEELDATVARAGVRDASSHAIPGFPHLRTSRFLSALGPRLRGQEAHRAWVEEMVRLGLSARKKEIYNLPDKWAKSLLQQYDGDRQALYERARECSQRILAQVGTASLPRLLAEAAVPDEYSFVQSALGLYPLAALPVALLTLKARGSMEAYFRLSLEQLPVEGILVALAPPRAFSLSEGEIRELLHRSRAHLLGVPILDQESEWKLATALAPVFLQDVATPRDRFGRVHWMKGRVRVERKKPAVYYYLSTAFLKGNPVIQINYVIWYPQRGGRNTPWFERGSMDGLTVRLTLDQDGQLAVADMMNNCGCYHSFWPRQDLVQGPRPGLPGLGPFAPGFLPVLFHGDRLGVRVSSGRHQVQGLFAAAQQPDQTPYELIPYEILEALPRDEESTESVFDAHGILKGSERAEQFLLFSMGIPRIGSMRQRGHHAIDFFDRVHFDDPDLLDRSFVFR